MKMEVLLKDSDIVSMVLEFLHARKLYESAIVLEKETGILPALNGSMPEHLQYLRRLAIDGEWDNVLFYLEPFTELDEFNTSKLNYFILRQKYMEILHEMSRSKSCNTKDKENLKKVVKEIQPFCSREELLQMKAVHVSYLEESYNLYTTRMLCFKNILDVLGPFFDSHGSGAMGQTEADWAQLTTDSNVKNKRLESVVSDSLVISECYRYCIERATHPGDSKTTGLPFLSTAALNRSESDFSNNASLLFWIRSLKHDDLFCQRYEIEEVQVKTEALKKFNPHRPEPEEPPRKFTSFASPKQSPKYAVPRSNGPLVTQSVPSPERFARNRSNHLASSGPSYHPHLSSRNYSNNNNNNADVPENTGQHVILSSLKKSPPDDEDSQRKVSVKDQNVSEAADVKTEHFKQEFLQNDENILASPQFQDVRSEKPLRDSSNLQTLKVSESYDKFFEEKRRRKNENQQFLKDLEEKEKKNDEIRKLLLQQHGTTTHSNGGFSSNESTQKQSPRAPSDQYSNKKVSVDEADGDGKGDNKNLESLTKGRFIPVEFTEDLQAIRAVSFHPSGQVYAIGSNSKTLRICSVHKDVISTYTRSPRDQKAWDELKNRSPRPSSIIAQRNDVHKGSIYCMAWNDDGSLLATGSNDKLIKTHGFDILGKTLAEKPQELAFHRGIVREVTFLRESCNTLASGGADGNIYTYDCKHEKIIHSLAGHTGQVLGLYSWHQNMLASSSQDKTIRLWDARAARCVSIIGTGNQEPCVATSVCVDNSGQLLALGQDDSKIGIYDLKAGKMAMEYKCHENEVRCLRFNPVFENQLLSSSYDGTVVLTDVDGMLSDVTRFSHGHHWDRVAACKNKLIQCKWHPNGEAFATTSVDKMCKLWLRVNA